MKDSRYLEDIEFMYGENFARQLEKKVDQIVTRGKPISLERLNSLCVEFLESGHAPTEGGELLRVYSENVRLECGEDFYRRFQEELRANPSYRLRPHLLEEKLQEQDNPGPTKQQINDFLHHRCDS